MKSKMNPLRQIHNNFFGGVMSTDRFRLSANASWCRSVCWIAGYFHVLVLTAIFSALSGGAEAQSWEAVWSRTVSAAKTEGRLTLSAPAGGVWRDELMKFQEAYPEIKVDITTAPSRDYWARIEKEREAGQYLWDMRIGGLDTLTYRMKAIGFMAPLRPELVLPEVTDGTKWRNGFDGLFFDAEHKYFVSFCMYESFFGYFNEQIINPAEITSMQDLLKPSLKGKLSLQDPRGGAGLVNMGVAYRRLGEAYVRSLVAEQIGVVTNDPRQQVEWALSGRYPIAIGLPSAILVDYQKRGVPMPMRRLSELKEWSAGVCSAQMLQNAPHPNATRLFINWLLTSKVQTELMTAVQLNSMRTDVPPGASDRVVPADKISEYVADQTEDVMPYQEKAGGIFKELLK
jgi:iron(III) transport system substrate-binding protein